jgi:hypothetical protein
LGADEAVRDLARKEWHKDVAEKTGLGFALPASSEISIGQLGQPEVVRSEEAKAA